MKIQLKRNEFYHQLVLPGMTPVMQKQIEYKPHYLASELPEDIMDSVCDKYIGFNTEIDGWWEYEYEEFKDEMKRIGFEVSDIYFSGFSSQGDGACYEGSLIDADKFIKAMKYKVPSRLRMKYLFSKSWRYEFLDNMHISTKHNGHYCHSGCMDISFSEDAEFLDDNEFSELEDIIIEFVKDKADNLYSALQTCYEYLSTPESICEGLDANDHNFYIDGEEE